MSIDELLRSRDRRDYASTPEADALVDTDALREADLVDVRLHAVDGTLALLLDLRTALQFRLANTAVLVMRDPEEVRWSSQGHRAPRRTAHHVMSSSSDPKGDHFAFKLVCLQGWALSAVALSAEFFVGDVPGLPPVPPDFLDEDNQAISNGMPSWDSVFKPGWATFADATVSGLRAIRPSRYEQEC